MIRTNREYVLLAQDHESRYVDGLHYMLSEKLDGFRMFWDGGISRGFPASSVPWANTAKDGRYIFPPIATGLWSRYGKVIQAPPEYLDMLPNYVPLDMEMWFGRGNFQRARSVCAQLTPVLSDWQEGRMMVLDRPRLTDFLQDGKINNTNCKLVFKDLKYHRMAAPIIMLEESPADTFQVTHEKLKNYTWWNDHLVLHEQSLHMIGPNDLDKAIEKRTEEIKALGGEGLMLRKANSYWTPYRMTTLLKIKPLSDHEGIVIGYTTGVEGKEGRRLGKLGSLQIQTRFRNADGSDGPQVIFNLSGFNDGEIELPEAVSRWAYENPDCPLPEQYQSDIFPRGSVVGFQYRELSDEGKPKEARYWRR